MGKLQVMDRRVSALLAAVVITGVAGGGTLVFSALSATASGFTGPFGGPYKRGGTPEQVQASLVGEEVAMRSLTLAGNGTYTADVLTLHSGQIRMVPTTVAANGYIRWNDSIEGFDFGKPIINCAGCAARIDIIEPRQATVPVRIDGAHGLRIGLQSAVGTCGSSEEPEGTTIQLAATASSATRLCRCIRTSSSGDYRWFNMDNATRGSTTTDCPETTP